MNKIKNGIVFVTVGTTKFDQLITTLTEEEVLHDLHKCGFHSIIAQIGSGEVFPNKENCEKANIKLSFYRYKNTISQDIKNADLIISHAGAGTCLEVLAEKKPLIVVVNENLMHNHQTELANQLAFEGYLYSCTCNTLAKTINGSNFNDLKEMPPVQQDLFSNFLNEFIGFS